MSKDCPSFRNQKGIVHLLVLIAALGLIAFLIVSSLGSFKSSHLFGQIYNNVLSTFASTSLPAVTITGIAVNNSSAKIDFQPVAGAKDYRVYDTAKPTTVKYAGMRHYDAGIGYHFVLGSDGNPVWPYQTDSAMHGTGPQTIDAPGTEIEWNSLQDNLPHNLVVEAVDNLGPVPPDNLTDNNNNPISTTPGMLGANAGNTPDGKNSTNGQGPSTNNPQAIAQSASFTVQSNPSYMSLPSKADAGQVFYDNFDDTEAMSLVQTGTSDGKNGNATYTLNAGTSKAWDVLIRGADVDHSMPFIKGAHFMDTLFAGITPSAYSQYYIAEYHTKYSNTSLSPQTTADFSNGKMLHLTEEIDSQMSNTFRWLAWQLAPSNDPLTNFRAADDITGGSVTNANKTAINTSDQALWLQLFPNNCEISLMEGPKSSTDTGPKANNFVPLGAQTGSTTPLCYRIKQQLGGNGIGLDNRERWDIFLTTTHLALFENGNLVIQKDIPDGGIPFNNAKVYFTHYVYALDDNFEKRVIANQMPWFTYWENIFKYSDERHWDNMGFEVLPASDVPLDSTGHQEFSSLSQLIHLPTPIVPNPSGSPSPSPSSTPVACAPVDMPKNITPLGNVNAGNINLSWSPVPNATSYLVHIDDLSNPYSGNCSQMNSGDYCADNVLTPSVPFSVASGHNYLMWAQAKNSCGNLGPSNGVTISVPPVSLLTSPLVSITSPTNGSRITSNQVNTITTQVASGTVANGVIMSVNGKIICNQTTEPYSCSWFTPRGAANYTIQATMYDTMGMSSTSTINVSSQ